MKIRGAIEEVKKCENHSTIIVNVGSVDIAEGRQLIQMITDFCDLMQVCVNKSISPIVTTLAPLPNYQSYGNRASVLDNFNFFLRGHYLSQSYSLIDLNLCMSNPDQTGNSFCYQAKTRHVTGSRRKLQMWNSFGRKKVLDMLKMNLGEVILCKECIGSFC